MVKYEYELVGRDQCEKLEFFNDVLNEMAEAGWRLTIVSDWFFCFERPVEDDSNG